MRVEMEGKHGRTRNGGPGDRGAWSEPPPQVARVWQGLAADARYEQLVERHPKVNRNAAPALHLGTLGTGNHFIELGLDELDRVWVMRRFAVLTVKG